MYDNKLIRHLVSIYNMPVSVPHTKEIKSAQPRQVARLQDCKYLGRVRGFHQQFTGKLQTKYRYACKCF